MTRKPQPVGPEDDTPAPVATKAVAPEPPFSFDHDKRLAWCNTGAGKIAVDYGNAYDAFKACEEDASGLARIAERVAVLFPA